MGERERGRGVGERGGCRWERKRDVRVGERERGRGVGERGGCRWEGERGAGGIERGCRWERERGGWERERGRGVRERGGAGGIERGWDREGGIYLYIQHFYE